MSAHITEPREGGVTGPCPKCTQVSTDQSQFHLSISKSPGELIQTLLSKHQEDDGDSHELFCQLDILGEYKGEPEWHEAARWVLYEEDVDEGGGRWSKPHVSSLSLHSLFELHTALKSGAVVLDTDIIHILQLVDLLLDHLIREKLLDRGMRDSVRVALTAPHRHFQQKRKRLGDMTRSESRSGSKAELGIGTHAFQFPENQSFEDLSSPNLLQLLDPEHPVSRKMNKQMMKMLASDSEVANMFIAELDALKQQVCAFVRLREARIIGDLTEVPLPTKFVFILLGPTGSQTKMFEMGRAMSTMMVDQVFRQVVYHVGNKNDLLNGVDEFLNQVTVLPPCGWDPDTRLDPPEVAPPQEARRQTLKPKEDEEVEDKGESSHWDPTLQRTGRLFGGLIADVKRKIPWYLSDFKDGLHLQSVASVIFLFLATLTPNVTFGGLLSHSTDHYMGAMECILAASITGVLFALCSGQPMNILGSTGPMLVMEMIIFNFCDDNGLDFMPFRVWIGLWTSIMVVLIVMFDLSSLVRYITRFTEESFACLIALIFIWQSFTKLYGILHTYPYERNPDPDATYDCSCYPPYSEAFLNMSLPHHKDEYVHDVDPVMVNGTIDYIHLSVAYCEEFDGVLVGVNCDHVKPVPDAFFVSVLLFIGTFALARVLYSLKTSRYFPALARRILSDFAVLISVIMMVLFDRCFGVPTPKLHVPHSFQPTNPSRGWFINPIGEHNPWWLALAAILPAGLATILVFMDQQITALIVNRKENLLQKGHGYHLDMLVVAVCIAICSLLGLPWFVAATVSAIAHMQSLKRESECNAPGEHPVFLGIREQRVTALMVGILSGCAIFFTSILSTIPMAVLYGVFFYMGVAALDGMQFVDRVMIIFMPTSTQPDVVYLRQVPIKRVHLFTFIQFLCLLVLWAIKFFKTPSIAFPLMVVGCCFVRKSLDWLFDQDELMFLDEVMPGAHDRKKNKQEELGLADVDERALLTEKPVENGLSPNESIPVIVIDDTEKTNDLDVPPPYEKPSFFISPEDEAKV